MAPHPYVKSSRAFCFVSCCFILADCRAVIGLLNETKKKNKINGRGTGMVSACLRSGRDNSRIFRRLSILQFFGEKKITIKISRRSGNSARTQKKKRRWSRIRPPRSSVATETISLSFFSKSSDLFE